MTSASRRESVRVPATSANLGAGFDCIGFALDRWLTASVTADDSGPAERANTVTIHREGTLAGLTIPAEDDALVVGFAAACKAANCVRPAKLAFSVLSQIPVGRGLGSSSAALVAGALLADAVLELRLGRSTIADLCTEIEGHPDNVAPAIFGGATLGVPNDSVGGAARIGDGLRWVFSPIEIHARLAFAFVVPPFPVSTAAARAMLPREVPHIVAVRAAGKGAALAHGLVTGQEALLRIALDDVLHVPYRRTLLPGMDDVVAAAVGAGAYGATLSGSGSSLVAVAHQDKVESVADAMRASWKAHGVDAEAFVQRRPAIL
jgi:homoserine kinase